MNQLATAVAMPSWVGPVPDRDPAEIAPQEDDIVKLGSHLVGIPDHVSGGQGSLPSVQELLALNVKQITSFLG
ncbi:hypothetical protein [Candidatus Entotheonella palauensis]|uniref:Uncharacterized protein n=1 Tax=Candidatus Entotheonella gemina TaxID=1429439 RepID=W4MBQ9_9BACT|nr:hypothetical protein [Candidatus Entotheonella palauensis]ETX07640.1 MAG: hypothetical protein ETSY2_10065 [Candidatus Entotheonella gemina]